MSAPVSEPGQAKVREQAKAEAGERREVGKGHVMGNLTGDPELRYTPTGRAVVRLRLAYTPRIHDARSDSWSDGPTEYYDVQAWGQQAENAAECLIKGDRVVAAGTWSERDWTDREGQLRTTTELTAQDIGPSLLFRQVHVKRTARARAGAGDAAE